MTSLIMICLSMALSMPGPQRPKEEQPEQDLAGYTLTGIEMTNTEPLRSEYLRDSFPIRDGDPFDSGLITKGLEIIVSGYQNLGYVDFTYTPHQDINLDKKTISCTFEFIPGPQYRTNRIQIFGTGSSEEENEIRSVLLLEEQRIFSLATFYRSLKLLNEYLEDKDLALKDHEFKRSSEHPGKVDVSFWVIPKE